jgi:hypothetical protein
VGLDAELPSFVVGYAFCWVVSPDEREVGLAISSGDGNKVWLNHRPIGGHPTFGFDQPDRSRYPVHLRAGRNPFLVKVEQGTGEWCFAVRFLKGGEPVRDLAVELE